MARSNNNLTAVMQDTANAIREKTGSSEDICPRDFGDQILAIPTGITPTGKIEITQNGDNIDVTQYASAKVNVSGSGPVLKSFMPRPPVRVRDDGTIDETGATPLSELNYQGCSIYQSGKSIDFLLIKGIKSNSLDTLCIPSHYILSDAEAAEYGLGSYKISQVSHYNIYKVLLYRDIFNNKSVKNIYFPINWQAYDILSKVNWGNESADNVPSQLYTDRNGEAAYIQFGWDPVLQSINGLKLQCIYMSCNLWLSTKDSIKSTDTLRMFTDQTYLRLPQNCELIANECCEYVKAYSEEYMPTTGFYSTPDTAPDRYEANKAEYNYFTRGDYEFAPFVNGDPVGKNIICDAHGGVPVLGRGVAYDNSSNYADYTAPDTITCVNVDSHIAWKDSDGTELENPAGHVNIVINGHFKENCDIHIYPKAESPLAVVCFQHVCREFAPRAIYVHAKTITHGQGYIDDYSHEEYGTIQNYQGSEEYETTEIYALDNNGSWVYVNDFTWTTDGGSGSGSGAGY